MCLQQRMPLKSSIRISPGSLHAISSRKLFPRRLRNEDSPPSQKMRMSNRQARRLARRAICPRRSGKGSEAYSYRVCTSQIYQAPRIDFSLRRLRRLASLLARLPVLIYLNHAPAPDIGVAECLRITPSINGSNLLNAGNSAKWSAPLFSQVFASYIFQRVLVERYSGEAS